MCTYTPSLFILLHPSFLFRSSQSTKLSSLCCSAASHQLAFHTWQCIYINATLSIRPLLSLLCCVHEFIFYGLPLFMLCKQIHQYDFSRLYIYIYVCVCVCVCVYVYILCLVAQCCLTPCNPMNSRLHMCVCIYLSYVFNYYICVCVCKCVCKCMCVYIYIYYSVLSCSVLSESL